MKVVVYNLGCKVNKYECDSMVKALRLKQYEVSENLEYADIYILNTCAVTNEAERKSRQCVERCLKYNKDAKIFVCGCASENNPEQFIKKDNVQYVIGSANKMSLIDSFELEGISKQTLPKDYEDDFSPIIDRTRAFLKIQDGCNRFCSYCLIPYVRGRSRSRSIDSVVKECEEVAKTTKEMVITGIDVSMYGLDIGTNMVELLNRLTHIDCRIRFGSLECSIITNEFLQACSKLKNFCPQFHLSLQSGDDEVLKRMNRKYTTKEYLEKVHLIRSYFSDAAITTDLIVAFPTETEEQFKNTLNFIKEVSFSSIHIFPYSKREGTLAAKYKPLSGEISKRRWKQAYEVEKECKRKYLQSMIGKTLEVLIEEKNGEYYEGYSKEYIRVKIKEAKINDIIKCEAKEIENDMLICQ
ncbi:MAG: tRNA (N(6)-L-threonylcarbamoyladenosine(37)-C(2))-methylthiotransferase MtaB [Christensenella sp.]|nr:tRNA (N(6)-L-threonylcarbamoyladenosine(37)-C(2))-methylthiotransferase MtaB [Christensenella sp.]